MNNKMFFATNYKLISVTIIRFMFCDDLQGFLGGFLLFLFFLGGILPDGTC